AQSLSNRQGRGDVLEGAEAHRVLEILKNDSEQAYDHYMEMLNLDDETDEVLDTNKKGLTRELARMNLPVNYYTQWYWKIDLNNLMHFLMLRADPHAQYEIRVYAEAMLEVLEKWLPFTYEAFLDYRLKSATLSSQMVEAVKKMINGEKITKDDTELSQREWDEMCGKLGLKLD
ncbi:FAD-dependent thymidylate synthase, partial [Candidatus Saccharibacteria bacterium]|nr:FAD-dependent thymidylate synthase [Candidatus Saccharibacteria bacterium]